MEDTQKYLNSILEKRLGSVPNHAYFSKNVNTVTRLPKKQQKLESMPTVFRVKQQTIYRTTGVMPGSVHSQNPLLQSSKSPQVLPLKKQDSGHNQRVEYVAISKRIESKKQQLSAPTVDVTKYRKTTYVPPENVTHQNPSMDINQANNQFYRSTGNSGYRQSNIQVNNMEISEEGMRRQAMLKPSQNESNFRMSQVSLGSQKSKRRNIFGGLSKQKNYPRQQQ